MASNHDVGRFATRWCGGDERKIRLALLVLATLPGATVLYYGDEIGMTDVDVPLELQRDPMSRGAGHGWHGNRDRARTPMQWDATATAGFTAQHVAPWLPVGDSAAVNVASQREDPGSVLRWCRDLLALRRAESGGQLAAYQALPGSAGVWAYQSGSLAVLANFSDQPVTCASPGGQVLAVTAGQARPAGAEVTLGPWQGLITRAVSVG
jgi:alpha-glucosidase